MKIKIFLFLLTLPLMNLSTAQVNCGFVKGSSIIIDNNPIAIVPFISGSKPHSEIKIEYFENEILIHTADNTDTFLYKPGNTFSYSLSAVVTLFHNGKVYYTDTQNLQLTDYRFLTIEMLVDQKMQFVYADVVNMVKIVTPGIHPVNIVVTTTANVRSLGNYEYEIKPGSHQIGQEIKFILSYKQDDGSMSVLKSFVFPVIAAPAPIIGVKFHGLSSDSAFVLNACPKKPFPYSYNTGVDSFTLVYTLNGKTYKSTQYGKTIKSETIKDLRLLPSDSWIYFENIYCWIQYSENNKILVVGNTAFKLP